MRRHPTLPTVAAIGVVVAAAVAFAARRLQPVKVRGASMAPTLAPGDLVAVSPAPVVVARGDVVVVRVGEIEAIKRAVAVAGDRYHGAPVATGHLFLTGDNPAASTDSRTWGSVGLDAVAGVARAVYWPPARWRIL